MNKIFKYIIGIGVILLGIGTCNAGLIGQSKIISFSSNCTAYDFGDGGCVMKPGNRMWYNTTNSSCVGSTEMSTNVLYCFTGIVYINGSTTTNMPIITGLVEPCPTCKICDDPYTSLQCQTEYNLIPLSSVTQNYCELNFNLIDPSTCPINEGNGVVNWSSLFINNTQYAGNDNIEIFIPDFIGWSIIYNSGTNYIDIEGYNADTEYIEDIINKEKLTPTTEDATRLAQGLTEFIPYIFISMIVLYTLYLIRKLFKS